MTGLVTRLPPRHQSVQGPQRVGLLRSAQITVADRTAKRRARLAELDGVSLWRRSIGGHNSERKRLQKRLATLDVEGANMACETGVALRTIEDLLGPATSTCYRSSARCKGRDRRR
jgi:hypothetical protein